MQKLERGSINFVFERVFVICNFQKGYDRAAFEPGVRSLPNQA
ncbi:hypothetical protein [Nostoc sp.]